MRCLFSIRLLCTLALSVPLGSVGADPLGGTLRHNPFERPPPAEHGGVEEATASSGTREPPPVLRGTLVSSDAPMAILGGKLLGLGGEHAGYRLVAVEEGAAVFDYRGERVELKVDVDQKDATGRKR